MTTITKPIEFPSELWARVEKRAASADGIPCLVDGEPGVMRYMNPGYLVGVLVKRGLDELDKEGKDA